MTDALITLPYEDGARSRWDSAEKLYRTPGAWSPSRIASLSKATMAHVLWEMQNPKPPTAAMALGTAVHALVFQPDDLDSILLIADRQPLSGKGVTAEVKQERKDAWDEIRARAEKERLTIVGTDAMEQARAIASRVAELFALVSGENEFAAAWCDGSLLCERRVGWTDAATGINLHGILDGADPAGMYIGDLKTVESAELEQVQRAIFFNGYHIKCAAYREAVRSMFGPTACQRVWLPVVENKEPYEPRMLELHKDALDEGERIYRECLLRVAEWESDPSCWLGYPLGCPSVGIPRWAYRR